MCFSFSGMSLDRLTVQLNISIEISRNGFDSQKHKICENFAFGLSCKKLFLSVINMQTLESYFDFQIIFGPTSELDIPNALHSFVSDHYNLLDGEDEKYFHFGHS